MTKNILIIGGTGFLGYHLAKKCSKNYNVTSLSLNKPSKEMRLKNVKYFIGDISKRNMLKDKIKKNFNIIVNLGGYINHKNKKLALDTHYRGCKNLVDFFLKKDIELFVQIGSSTEYGKQKSPNVESIGGNPSTIYAQSKLKATKLLQNLKSNSKSFPFVILRFYQVYGPNQNYDRLIPMVIKSSLANEKFNCSSGIQGKDFLYVDDAINAILKSFNNKNVLNKIINIGSGKKVKVKNLIKRIVKKIKLGKPLFGVLKMRSDEPKDSYPSIKRAKKLLNWEPKLSLDKGLSKTINYYKVKKDEL